MFQFIQYVVKPMYDPEGHRRNRFPIGFECVHVNTPSCRDQSGLSTKNNIIIVDDPDFMWLIFVYLHITK